MTKTEPPNPIPLKSCPFCGGEARSEHRNEDHYQYGWIECCICRARTGSEGAKRGAVKAWNTRARPTQESVAAPIPHVASKTLVEELEAEKITGARSMLCCGERYNQGLDDAIAIVRKHEADQPVVKESLTGDVVVRVANAICNEITPNAGEGRWKCYWSAAKAAIAAMGDASARKDEEEAQNGQLKTNGDQPALIRTTSPARCEISVISDSDLLKLIEANVTWNFDCQRNICTVFLYRVIPAIRPYLATREPVSLEKCKDAVTNLPGYYEAHDDVIKAGLSAVGVPYV